MKYLIVNADDFNLTYGTKKAILECHDKGVVTSTTLLMTLPLGSKDIHALKKRPLLGKGVHLSLTLGNPVSKQFNQKFSRSNLSCLNRIPKKKIYLEFKAQIELFKSKFSFLPSHCDTHHHIQKNPTILSVIRKLSLEYGIEYRRDKNLFSDLDPENHWTLSSFSHCLKKLPKGISEIMVHPGFCDQALRRISRFSKGREVERKVLLHENTVNLVKNLNIKLINFSEIPYFSSLF